jgi:hypothetical protein
MASPSWLTYFCTTVRDVEPAALSTLFFTTHALATLSNFAVLALGRGLGPVKIMTLTHLLSGVFLALIGFPEAGAPGTPIFMGRRVDESDL